MTTRPASRLSKVWPCASSRRSPATGARDADADEFLDTNNIPVISDIDTRAWSAICARAA